MSTTGSISTTSLLLFTASAAVMCCPRRQRADGRRNSAKTSTRVTGQPRRAVASPCLRSKEVRPPGTIGKVLRTKKVRIIDETTLEEVPQGEAGELIVSSDHMVSAYWKKEEETQEAFLEIDGSRWYRTGDVVRMDENGFFYFVDRTADTIKHKGYRVSSSEIEAALQEHPAVLAACAVGVPDEKVGERIKAFVVLKARRERGHRLRPDPLVQGAPRVVQDSQLHRVQGHVAEIKGGQAAEAGVATGGAQALRRVLACQVAFRAFCVAFVS